MDGHIDQLLDQSPSVGPFLPIPCVTRQKDTVSSAGLTSVQGSRRQQITLTKPFGGGAVVDVPWPEAWQCARIKTFRVLRFGVEVAQGIPFTLARSASPKVVKKKNTITHNHHENYTHGVMRYSETVRVPWIPKPPMIFFWIVLLFWVGRGASLVCTHTGPRQDTRLSAFVFQN